MVLLRPVALLDPRVARRARRGPRPLLPDVDARDGARHPVLLGRPHDDDGHQVDRKGPLRHCFPARAGQGRRGQEDEQEFGQRRRPRRRRRECWGRRAAVHPGDRDDPRTGPQPQPGEADVVAQPDQQAVERRQVCADGAPAGGGRGGWQEAEAALDARRRRRFLDRRELLFFFLAAADRPVDPRVLPPRRRAGHGRLRPPRLRRRRARLRRVLLGGLHRLVPRGRQGEAQPYQFLFFFFGVFFFDCRRARAGGRGSRDHEGGPALRLRGRAGPGAPGHALCDREAVARAPQGGGRRRRGRRRKWKKQKEVRRPDLGGVAGRRCGR